MQVFTGVTGDFYPPTHFTKGGKKYGEVKIDCYYRLFFGK